MKILYFKKQKYPGNLSNGEVSLLTLRNVVGKKVKLTPINIIIKWEIKNLGFKTNPVNNENQWVNPAIIANTAPIERT